LRRISELRRRALLVAGTLVFLGVVAVVGVRLAIV
jgi:hypothetical protein